MRFFCQKVCSKCGASLGDGDDEKSFPSNFDKKLCATCFQKRFHVWFPKSCNRHGTYTVGNPEKLNFDQKFVLLPKGSSSMKQLVICGPMKATKTVK